jgi:heme-degrading monooxygenase HmoA
MKTIMLALGLALVLVVGLVEFAATQEGRPRGPMAGFPDLVGGLKATPGCIGVETARTSGGKNVIFAWFRDKAAVLSWYKSDMHRGAQDRFFPNRPAH